MKNNPIEEIKEDMEHNTGISSGMFVIRSANDTLKKAQLKPDPVDLYKGLIIENEVSCLFADSGVGKTILAVQIGEEVAKSRKVLYVDCELSDKQFQRRYTGPNGELHEFPPGFYRAELCRSMIDLKDFEESLMTNIEAAANKVEAKVIIIDNLTYLCNAAEKGEVASEFMKKIVAKKEYGWTVLVVGHTNKRMLWYPLTENDLSGSKRLINFFDAAFCLGVSSKNTKGLRYIKQVKVRSAELKFNENNVLVCQIAMSDDNALRLEFISHSPEREHLCSPTDEELARRKEQIKKMHDLGKSCRDIASETGMSKSRVSRIIVNMEESNNE